MSLKPPFKLHIPSHGFVVMSDKDYDQATVGPADKATIFHPRPGPGGGYILEFKDKEHKALGIHSFEDLPLIPKPVCTLPPVQNARVEDRMRYVVKIKQHDHDPEGRGRGRVVLAIEDISMFVFCFVD